eukprot:TRINITY_DN10407_c0_g1_i1.p2 TRINITY_DN10407_c0_g1~~TRINITY_DN10407_c0_g1_i1.p2  ORF type:complete len:141 (-),score=28.12 TRINITY_DN10407_c0_g1_i1:139-561(-)
MVVKDASHDVLVADDSYFALVLLLTVICCVVYAGRFMSWAMRKDSFMDDAHSKRTIRTAGLLTIVVSLCLLARSGALMFTAMARRSNQDQEVLYHQWYFAVPYYVIGEFLPNFLVLVVLRSQRAAETEDAGYVRLNSDST